MGQGSLRGFEVEAPCVVQIQVVTGCNLLNRKTRTEWISSLDLLDSKGLRAKIDALIFYD